MAHGYQFYNKILHHLILAPAWKSYIEDDKDRKGLNKFLFKTKTFLKKLSGQDESIGRDVKNDSYFNYIVEYISEHNLNAVSYVIFGHSHVSAQVAKDELEIINSGCWLSNKTPNYIEILNNGTTILRDFS